MIRQLVMVGALLSYATSIVLLGLLTRVLAGRYLGQLYRSAATFMLTTSKTLPFPIQNSTFAYPDHLSLRNLFSPS